MKTRSPETTEGEGGVLHMTLLQTRMFETLSGGQRASDRTRRVIASAHAPRVLPAARNPALPAAGGLGAQRAGFPGARAGQAARGRSLDGADRVRSAGDRARAAAAQDDRPRQLEP